jgi:hypothetical protein
MKLHNYTTERGESSQLAGAAGITIPEPSTLDVRSHSDETEMSVHLQMIWTRTKRCTGDVGL